MLHSRIQLLLTQHQILLQEIKLSIPQMAIKQTPPHKTILQMGQIMPLRIRVTKRLLATTKLTQALHLLCLHLQAIQLANRRQSRRLRLRNLILTTPPTRHKTAHQTLQTAAC